MSYWGLAIEGMFNILWHQLSISTENWKFRITVTDLLQHPPCHGCSFDATTSFWSKILNLLWFLRMGKDIERVGEGNDGCQIFIVQHNFYFQITILQNQVNDMYRREGLAKIWNVTWLFFESFKLLLSRSPDFIFLLKTIQLLKIFLLIKFPT